MSSKAEKILTLIQSQIGGELKISIRKVPYLNWCGFNICYFGRTRSIKVFKREGYNYRGFMSFKHWNDLVSHFKDYIPKWNSLDS